MPFSSHSISWCKIHCIRFIVYVLGLQLRTCVHTLLRLDCLLETNEILAIRTTLHAFIALDGSFDATHEQID